MSCKLCLKDKPLMDSHVFPDFVIKWLLDTSATPYFRNLINPNKREQDGPKSKILCWDCEQRFSQWEKKFSEKVFVPFINSFDKEFNIVNHFSVEYKEWLLKFVISIQWRAMNHDPFFINNPLPSQFLDTKENWRTYLISDDYNKIYGDTHLYFLKNTSIVALFREDCPANLNRFLLRMLDSSPIVSLDGKNWGFYSKFGPLAICSNLGSKFLNGETTKVNLKGNISSEQYIGDTLVTEWLWVTRPSQVLEEFRPISEKQELKIKHFIEKNKNRFLSSESLIALELDKKLNILKK